MTILLESCERFDALPPSTIVVALGILIAAVAAVEALTRRLAR